MQKEMKSKLYSHFVKSGTLMGGNFTKEAEEGFLEVYFYCFKKILESRYEVLRKD
jgi:hypothetical protein